MHKMCNVSLQALRYLHAGHLCNVASRLHFKFFSLALSAVVCDWNLSLCWWTSKCLWVAPGHPKTIHRHKKLLFKINSVHVLFKFINHVHTKIFIMQKKVMKDSFGAVAAFRVSSWAAFCVLKREKNGEHAFWIPFHSIEICCFSLPIPIPPFHVIMWCLVQHRSSWFQFSRKELYKHLKPQLMNFSCKFKCATWRFY